MFLFVAGAGSFAWFVHSSKFEGPVIVSLEPWVWLKAL